MKISVIGIGYVGLVTGACFAEMGNRVCCVDNDVRKINGLKEGKVPIYEPGLEDMVRENMRLGHLNFTTDITEAIKNSNICFIAVGTPMGDDSSANLEYVKEVALSIGRAMKKHMYIVIKSTVPVGTSEVVRDLIEKELKLRNISCTFDVISNPEFLKEGTAISDSLNPDRIVVGVDNLEAADVMKELYSAYVKDTDRFIVMDIPSSEMTKYTANAMLATKISFMNEIANICEQVGANVNKVRLGIGSDSRIGYSFIYPGCGYGGSCFPKDVKALINTSMEYGYSPSLLKAVEDVNCAQKKVLVNKIVKRMGERLTGKVFAIWGLSFKPGTDDMREAPSITIINELSDRGAKIVAYDPRAMKEAQNRYLTGNKSVSYVDSKYEAVKNADALILVTEWKEFRQPDFEEIVKLLKKPIIFDGRNQYDGKRMKSLGIEYYQIGVRNAL